MPHKLKNMPFKSKAQMKKFFAMEARGEIKKGTAERWAKHTKNIKKLPVRIGKKSKNNKVKSLAQKKSVPAGMHKMPNGMMMKDSEMKAMMKRTMPKGRYS